MVADLLEHLDLFLLVRQVAEHGPEDQRDGGAGDPGVEGKHHVKSFLGAQRTEDDADDAERHADHDGDRRECAAALVFCAWDETLQYP